MENIFIKEALKESLNSYFKNEVPVGSIIVKENKIIARGHNSKETTNISLNHAEISSIKSACLILNSWRLSNTSMFVTLEPCIMCAGAIIESRIKNLYIGCHNPYNGFFSSNTFKIPNLNIFWLNDKKCEYILNRFFKKLRKGDRKNYHHFIQ